MRKIHDVIRETDGCIEGKIFDDTVVVGGALWSADLW